MLRLIFTASESNMIMPVITMTANDPHVQRFKSLEISATDCRFMPRPSRRRSTTSVEPNRIERAMMWMVSVTANPHMDCLLMKCPMKVFSDHLKKARGKNSEKFIAKPSQSMRSGRNFHSASGGNIQKYAVHRPATIIPSHKTIELNPTNRACHGRISAVSHCWMVL